MSFRLCICVFIFLQVVVAQQMFFNWMDLVDRTKENIEGNFMQEASRTYTQYRTGISKVANLFGTMPRRHLRRVGPVKTTVRPVTYSLADPCSGGLLQWKEESINTCNGRLCSVYDPGNSSCAFSGECFVEYLLCENMTILNLAETLGVVNCSISGWKDYRYVQVSCIHPEKGSLSFGYESFGFDCEQQELICDGEVVPSSNYSQSVINSDNCFVRSLPCQSSSNDTCYSLSLSGCGGSSSSSSSIGSTSNSSSSGSGYCHLNVKRFSCSRTCHAFMNITSCACPDDLSGPRCERRRPFDCLLHWNYPSRDCLRYDGVLDELDRDCACHMFPTRQAYAELGFCLECKFARPPAEHNFSFDYWLDSPKFRLSQEADWTLEFVSYDFDNLGSPLKFSTILSPNETTGESLVWFNLSLSHIPDRFWSGARLYFEVQFTDERDTGSFLAPAGCSGKVLGHDFVDIVHSHFVPENPNWPPATVIVSVVFPVFAFLGIAIGVPMTLGIWYFRFYLPQKRKRKPA